MTSTGTATAIAASVTTAPTAPVAQPQHAVAPPARPKWQQYANKAKADLLQARLGYLLAYAELERTVGRAAGAP